MKSLTNFLEDKLKLRVNEDKSAVDLAWRRTFLGAGFYRMKGEVRLRLAPKTIKKFKKRIRELTSRRISMSMKERIKGLNEYLVGWIGYYHMTDMKSHLQRFASWIRRRLRMCLWKQWKKVKTRIRKLRGLNIPDEEAIKFANSRKGYWRLSKSYHLHKALGNQYWAKMGLVDLVATYSEHRK